MPDADRRAPRALLLTAGLGTRLRPLTNVRAKAAVPINGKTLVQRVIDWLAASGISDLVLNLHHQPSSITSIVGDGSGEGVRVRYSWEHPVLGSAGGPRHALPLVVDRDDEDFLIVNGDTLTDVDVGAVLERHRTSGALVTMALIENPSPEKYGGVQVSRDGWVTGFSRARPGATEPTCHFIGVQVARGTAFADLEDGVPFESVNALYPRLMARNPEAIAAYVSRASFLDIGTPADCLTTSVGLARTEGTRSVGARARIADSAVIERTTIWDDVSVGAKAQLYDCIVADGVTIPAGARYERCAIVPATPNDPGDNERREGDLLVRRF